MSYSATAGSINESGSVWGTTSDPAITRPSVKGDGILSYVRGATASNFVIAATISAGLALGPQILPPGDAFGKMTSNHRADPKLGGSQRRNSVFAVATPFAGTASEVATEAEFATIVGEAAASSADARYSKLETQLTSLADAVDGFDEGTIKTSKEFLRQAKNQNWQVPDFDWHGDDAIVFSYRVGETYKFYTITPGQIGLLLEEDGIVTVSKSSLEFGSGVSLIDIEASFAT